MGLGYIFSHKWSVELLIDASFLSSNMLLAYLITFKTGFLIAFFVVWGVAIGLGFWLRDKTVKNGGTNGR